MSIEAWVISILVFSIQIFIAFYLFNRSKRDRMPSWAFRSLKINQLYPEFHNEPIKELEEKEFATEKRQYVKRFIFWNGGKNTIDKDDIKRPLKVKFRQNNALLCGKPIIIHRSRAEIDINATRENDEITISFDFLDYNDGIIFDFIYCGDRWAKLDMEGTIKGAKSINRGTFWMVGPKEVRNTYIELAKLIIIGVAPIAILFWKYNSDNVDNVPIYIYIVVAIGILLYWFLLYLLARIQLHESRFPDWSIEYIPNRPIDDDEIYDDM